MQSASVVVLGTGGTIAGTAASADDAVGYSAAQIGVEQLVRSVPALAGLPIVFEQVAQLDSKDMDPAVWRRLAQRVGHHLARPEVRGVVITHGTDTLEETAYVLHRVLAPAKPVVLTAAMRPATARLSDGPQNLVDAFAVVRAPGARGVLAVLAGAVHAAMSVSKRHSYRLDAFGSGEAGPVGYVEEGLVRLVRPWPEDGPAPVGLAALPEFDADWPWVEIVTSHAGSKGAIVDALVERGVRGIVVAGTGNGSIHWALEAALQKARAAGVRVLRCTRCADGAVVGALVDAPPDELPSAGALSPVKARIELLLELLAARA